MLDRLGLHRRPRSQCHVLSTIPREITDMGSVVINILVRHNASSLLSDQILHGSCHGTTADVNGLGEFMPQHIFGSFGDDLLVDQVLGSHIFGDGVASL